jgi:hypothetical protein
MTIFFQKYPLHTWQQHAREISGQQQLTDTTLFASALFHLLEQTLAGYKHYRSQSTNKTIM